MEIIAIDLKSFYASVECRERGLDPLTTNLVVADISRTQKTICLAVSPSLKAYGISGRARLFEVQQRVKEVNRERQMHAPRKHFTGESADSQELAAHPELAVSFVIARPQMAKYMKYSTEIYQIYLKYVSAEDIHVYSIDEVFMDVTNYLNMYGLTARELAMRIIQDILKTMGITATAGIGTNLYLAKIAMDIVAKHIPADKDGVRIASLDEMSYRKLLWTHMPLTDFWRVGRGYAKKLEELGLYTMGDIARCSLGKPQDFYNEDLLYDKFGVNAELLIDHAWGWEPCTIAQIKAYQPEDNSLGSAQVLACPYESAKARMVVREMTEALVLELVEKRLVTDQIVLTVGYDMENLTDPARARYFHGQVSTDFYGRRIPKPAHGSVNLKSPTSSVSEIIAAALDLYDRIVNPRLLIKRLSLTAAHVVSENKITAEPVFEQLDLFTDYEALEKDREHRKKKLEKERKLQDAMLSIKKKHGKNAILKGTSLEEGATAKERNEMIGGHKA